MIRNADQVWGISNRISFSVQYNGFIFLFFLPGGALLFGAGVFVATGGLHYSLLLFAAC
ncbi:MAG TPA: hypothetical protein VJ111_09670 [Chitinophagaceae bacterium]|nr:hypothetical protein [Chitinophagaceae bacterium]